MWDAGIVPIHGFAPTDGGLALRWASPPRSRGPMPLNLRDFRFAWVFPPRLQADIYINKTELNWQINYDDILIYARSLPLANSAEVGGSGNVKRKIAPRSRPLSTQTWPPWASTKRRTIAKPRPDPS